MIALKSVALRTVGVRLAYVNVAKRHLLVTGSGAFSQEKFFLQDIDPGNGLVLYFGHGPGDRKMNSCWDGAKALPPIFSR